MFTQVYSGVFIFTDTPQKRIRSILMDLFQKSIWGHVDLECNWFVVVFGDPVEKVVA